MSSLPHRVYANVQAISSSAPALKSTALSRRQGAEINREAQAREKRRIDRAADVLDRLEARVASLKARAKELTRRAERASARLQRIEDDLVREMEASGVALVDGVRRQLRTQLAPEALEIESEAKVPRRFFVPGKTPPDRPDKSAIKKALAADEDQDPADWGCRLTRNTVLVRR